MHAGVTSEGVPAPTSGPTPGPPGLSARGAALPSREEPMPDVVELSIPARAELLPLARLTVAAVAARADFDYEEIEDLRLALDELCSRLIGQPAGGTDGTLSLRYRWSNGDLEVNCQLAGAEQHVAFDEEERELSDRILDALVDDHGSGADGIASAWLRKRRRSAADA